jgi:mRNA interferase RelE/StbE
MKKLPYHILYTREAKKNIEKLDPSIKKIIRKAIESLAINPVKGKPLAYDLAGLHSLRTSDYRIIYRIREKKLLIIVVAVGHRKEIYKKIEELLKRGGLRAASGS